MPDYFWIDLDGGVNYEDTADKAKAEAERQIDVARDECEADEGWQEDVHNVCWGVVVERSQAIPRGTDDDGRQCVDYVLRGTEAVDARVERAEAEARKAQVAFFAEQCARVPLEAHIEEQREKIGRLEAAVRERDKLIADFAAVAANAERERNAALAALRERDERLGKEREFMCRTTLHCSQCERVHCPLRGWEPMR